MYSIGPLIHVYGRVVYGINKNVMLHSCLSLVDHCNVSVIGQVNDQVNMACLSYLTNTRQHTHINSHLIKVKLLKTQAFIKDILIAFRISIRVYVY